MQKKSFRSFSILILASLVSMMAGFVSSPIPVQAAGTVSTCNEASLNAALSTGGTVTFACSGVITITSTKQIMVDTTLDATGFDVTLDGGNAVRIFTVAAGIELTLNSITVQNATTGTGGAIDTRSGSLVILNSRFLSNMIALNASAVLHQGKIIKLFVKILRLVQWLNNGFARVIN